ncbi:hypothetical protein L1049_017847 [Liquidambar formosana]|uniref:DUF3511 domain-containing protein n=1 Tax=Liquidambar formosana TaxID=63359 RepID=A0AAP0NHM8_LIQFO
MADYRSKSYIDHTMQMESYYGTRPTSSVPHDLRCYSASYAQTQMGYNNNKDFKFKKGKSTNGSSSKSWSLTDPEFQRKRRVASYKAYAVEGRIKGSFRKSFRWLKNRYTEVVYGWW